MLPTQLADDSTQIHSDPLSLQQIHVTSTADPEQSLLLSGINSFIPNLSEASVIIPGSRCLLPRLLGNSVVDKYRNIRNV